MKAVEPVDPEASGGGQGPAARLALAPGLRVDRFELQALLHEGEASQLWRVVDTAAEAAFPQVLKIAREGVDAAVRLEVEASLLGLLGGPHVPALRARGEAQGRAYVVLEHLEGPCLQERLQDDLPIDEVVALAQGLARALHHVHRQGALHLDLQPRHLMFRPGGEVVLLSWGLARHDLQPDLHENELDLDNGAYLSPEQIQWQRHDLRSDLFGWAVLVYESLTRQRPFGTPRTPQQLRQRLTLRPLPPRALRADCPGWLQEALLRNLETDPALRHPTAAHLAFALAHPDPRRLTARAEWTAPPPAPPGQWWRGLVRACFPWLFRGLVRPPANPLPAPPISLQLHHHPVVMVVVDLALGEAHQAALRHQLEWTLSGVPDAHLACVTLAVTPSSEAEGSFAPAAPTPGEDTATPDAAAPPARLGPLARLRHWAHPLVHHAAARQGVVVSYHVIKCTQTAVREGRIVTQWARDHLVDQLVMPRRCADTLLAGGSPCTVTLVALPVGQVNL